MRSLALAWAVLSTSSWLVGSERGPDLEAPLVVQTAHKKSLRLYAGSRFPVATRWSQPFAVNLAEYLNATSALRDVVDVVSPFCFYASGITPNASAPFYGLVLLPGCIERVRGLLDQGYRVEPGISGGPNATVQVLRHRFEDQRFIDACVSAAAFLNASGLNFDFELEASNLTDGKRYAKMLGVIRAGLRAGNPTAVVSVATGTGTMGHTNVINTSAADEFISMGTYFGIGSFRQGVVQGIADVGLERYSAGLCDSCALQVGNNSLPGIDFRFSVLEAHAVQHIGWWLLEYPPPGQELNASLHHAYWWKKMRAWRAAPIATQHARARASPASAVAAGHGASQAPGESTTHARASTVQLTQPPPPNPHWKNHTSRDERHELRGR